MKSTIEIGIKIKDDGTTTAIAKLNSSLGSTQKAVQSNNKELNETQKSLKSIGSEGSSAFASLGNAISKVNSVGLQPLLKSLLVIGRATTTVLDSLSESFNKIAVTGAIMNNPIVASVSGIIGIGFAISALALKLKVLYAAITIVVKTATSIAAIFNVVKTQVVLSIKNVVTIINDLIKKIANIGTTVDPVTGVIITKFTMVSSILGKVQQLFNLTALSLKTVSLNVQMAGLYVDKLTLSLLKLNAAWDKDSVAVNKYNADLLKLEARIKNGSNVIQKHQQDIANAKNMKITKFGDDIINNINKLTSKHLPGLKNDIKNVGQVIKSNMTQVGTTVTDVISTFGKFDTRIISVLGGINNIINKNGSSIANASGFIVKNFKLIAGAAIAVGAAMVYGFANFSKLAEKADKLDDFSARMNMSAEAIQTWDTILNMAGTSMEQFAPAIDSLSRKAEAGDEAFTRLGISVKNSDGTFKNTEQIFNETVMALAGIPNQTQRSALAMQLLGKQGGRLNGILALGPVALAKMLEEYKKYNTITPEMIKQGVKWNDTMFLGNKLMEKGGNQYLTLYLNRFNHFIDVIKNSKLERLLVGPLVAVGGVAIIVSAALLKLIEVVALLGNGIDVVANGLNVMLAGMIKVASMLPFVSKGFKDFAKEYLQLSKEGAVESGKGFVDNLKRVLEMQKDVDESLRDYSNTLTDVADKEKKVKEVRDDGWNSLRISIRASLLERTEAGRLLLINEEETERLLLAARNNASQLEIQRIKYDAKLKRDVLIEEAAKTEQDLQDAMISAESGWSKFKLDKQKDSDQKSMELIDLAYADEYAKLLEQKDLLYITEETYQQRLLDLEKMSADEKANIQKESMARNRAEIIERANLYMDLGSAIGGAMTAIMDMNATKRKKDLEEEKDAGLDKLNNFKMTGRRRSSMEKQINDNYLAETKKIKEKEKKWAIAQAMINMAAGISAVWAQAGANWVLGAIGSGIQTVNGLAQVAAISAQNFKNSGVVGGFEGSQSGMDNTVVGARKGEMFLNTQDQKTLFNSIKSGNLGGGGGAIQITQGNIVIQGGANQSAIDQIKAETQRFSSLVKETVLDLQYRRQLSFV